MNDDLSELTKRIRASKAAQKSVPLPESSQGGDTPISPSQIKKVGNTVIIEDLQKGVEMLKDPKIQEAAKTVIKNNKQDLAIVSGSEPSKKQTNIAMKQLESPQKMNKIINKATENKKLSLSEQFSAGLAGALPQLLAGGVGLLLGGGEGALGAMEGVAQIQEQEAASKQQAAELAIKEKRNAIDEFAATTNAIKGQQEIELSKEGLKLKGRELDIKEKQNLFDLAEAYKKANPPAQEKLAKLDATSKQRLGSIMTGDRALNDMASAIERGENLFSALGESKYTDARNRFVESIARLQSGAAISDKEFDIYTGFTPATVEEKEVINEKMKRNRQFINDNLHLFGVSRQELNLPSPIMLMSMEEKIARRNELMQRRGK